MADRELTWRHHVGVAIASLGISQWIIGQVTLLALALDRWP